MYVDPLEGIENAEVCLFDVSCSCLQFPLIVNHLVHVGIQKGYVLYVESCEEHVAGLGFLFGFGQELSFCFDSSDVQEVRWAEEGKTANLPNTLFDNSHRLFWSLLNLYQFEASI